MKKILLIILFLSIGFSQNRVSVNNLVQYGAKWFKENEDKPFYGIVFDISKETGNKILEYRMMDWLKDGKYQKWFDDGTLKEIGYYKKGGKVKDWIYHTKIGQNKYKVSYKEDSLIVVLFIDNLDKEYKGLPITDKPNQDGQYFYNGDEYDFSKTPLQFITFVDGQAEGLVITWYENGQKKEEGTFKDGKLISSKYWNEDGSVKE